MVSDCMRSDIRWCGVTRIVKTAPSRARTGRTPFLRSGFCSPQTPSRSEGVLLKGVIGRFWCHVTVCDRREIMLVGADDFRELVADARRAVRCKAGQRRYIQTAPTYECLLAH